MLGEAFYQQFYDDWDQPNLLGVYARSKYMGERFVVENANRYLVCRAGSVVTKDIPSNCMAVGVPAKVIKTDIHMNDHARLQGEIRYKE